MNRLRFAFTLAIGTAGGLLTPDGRAQATIVDHNCTTLGQIPASAITQAKQSLRIAYGHTSHGSQLVDGMRALVTFMNRFPGDAYADNLFNWDSAFLADTPFSGASDLGNPDFTAWATATRTYLAAHPTTNVIIWSWCGQVSGASAANITNYLTLMSNLERDYPAVRFVYLTGHLDGTGATGNLNLRNQQIRDYCRTNGKTLYDFADIESYDPDGRTNFMQLGANDNCDYDSDGNGSLDRNWATVWQASHTQNVDWYDCSAAHSQSLNGNRKAYAAWWLWARLAGWSGVSGTDTTAPSVPASLRTTATACTRVDLAWNAATDAESGITGYRVSRGSTQIGTTSALTYVDSTVSPATPYSYTVVAVNGAGLVSAPSAALAVTTPADTTAPSTPASLQGTALSDTSAQLTWQAATDNIGVTSYRVYRDGALVGSPTGTSFTDTALTGSTTYAYRVAAVDAAVNVSTLSAAINVTTSAPDLFPAGGPYPATLSATGVFATLGTLAPSGRFVAYEPALPAWSDFASKRYWVARSTAGARLSYSALGNWNFPAGTTWVQHFDLETVRGDPATRRRVETRVLVRTTAGAVGLSYRWNDAQTDAALVAAAGADADFTITDAGATRTQRWHFPSRSECLQCHTAAAGFALGFNTRQLNRGSPNQLTALAQSSFLDTTPANPATLPALARITDAATPIETRARGWLDANCASCHQPGGSAAGSFDARFATPTGNTGLVGGTPQNNLGDGSNRLVVAGDPAHSLVVNRAGRRGAQQMPPVASGEVDPLGALLVSEWTRRLAQPANAAEGKVINLSTRGVVQEGESVLIGGFVIAGSGTKRLLLRGVGPTLGPAGITAPLGNPQIELFRGNTSIAANEDWGSSSDPAALAAAALATGAFPLPNGSRDAALLVTLEPGLYTVHVRGGAGANAVGLFEIYEVGVAAGSRLVNISSRVRLGVGERVAIPGLVVNGATRRTFLVRAVGPGLRPYGVTDTLGNPRLTVMAGQSPVATNDDWCTPSGSAVALAAAQVGAFALTPGSRDAALLISLDPGIYTVVTEGDSATEGVVLVEIYEVL